MNRKTKKIYEILNLSLLQPVYFCSYYTPSIFILISYLVSKYINLRYIRNLNCLLHLLLYIYEQRKRKKNEKRRRHITFFFSNMITRIEQASTTSVYNFNFSNREIKIFSPFNFLKKEYKSDVLSSFIHIKLKVLFYL
jgi:hypothetical protein